MKKNTALFCLICAAVLCALPLAGAEVHVTVRDIYNRPLAGVQIRIGDNGRYGESDGNGEFIFTASDSEAILNLYFAAPRFHKEKKTIALKKAVSRLKVYLIPLELLKEDITVTALNKSEKAIAVPFAQNVVSNVEIRESQPESVVQAVQNSPGVHFIGKGGVSVTPSIRGLARRRVLLLADGARITSDRSAGAAASFFPPEFIQQIEVIRSAASVLYGSDAIGGVLQIISRDSQNPDARLGSLNISGHSANQNLNGGISLARKFGKFSMLAAMQVSQAGDYEAAGETILNSGFSYATARLAVNYETEKRGLSLSFLKSAGRDIGKPERANDPNVSSVYPEENVNLLNISYHDDALIANGSMNFSFFMNPNDYELNKIKFSSQQLDISKNRAMDIGLRACLKKNLRRHLSYQFGADYYGRANVDMENETWKNNAYSSGSFPVENGRRDDLGVYVTMDYSGLAGFDLVGGARLGVSSRSAISDGVFLEKSSLAPALFLGVTRRIHDSLTLFFNAGSAYRVPSLSEAFYTGITGRSSIVGNPDLLAERSVNLDAGIKFHRRNTFIGMYLFQCSIFDMIEKFPLSATSYTYDNIERGRIRGLELEFQVYPKKSLEFFGNAFYYQGVSTVSGQYLNDIPSAKLFLGARFWLGRFWSEVNWMASAAVKHPGPAEVANADYQVTDIKAGCYLSNRFFLFLKAANVFNRAYAANADPDIPPAKGLDVSLGLTMNF